MISFLEGLFLFICAVNFLVPGRWAPDWYAAKVKSHSTTFFTLHAPACGLVLYFATGENQWKYIPASILMCLLYDFGSIWSTAWFTLANTMWVGFHHAAPLVAFYFQQPGEAWLNSILYTQIWAIHGFGFLRETLLPLFGIGEVEKNSSFDFWLHTIYAVMTPLAYALYVQYLPFGWNYSTLAVLLQMSGRLAAAGNFFKFEWMRRVECPGLIAVASYSYGGFKLAIPMLLIYITTVYFFVEKPASQEGSKKLVLTDEIREFMRTFPDEGPMDEKRKAESAEWFDNQAWAQKFPLFRAVMLRENDKVTQLIKDGADPSKLLTTWFSSVPMQWACSGGGVSTMKILIEAGANPFYKGVRDGTYMFNQLHSRKFYDELQSLAKKDEETVSSVNVDFLNSPVDFIAAQKFVKSKGGRLVTPREAKLLIAHRAADQTSEDGGDVEDVTCFATDNGVSSTFTCKVNNGESTPVIVGGETGSDTSKCSLLLWIQQKEQPESEKTEEKEAEAKVVA
jgi:hypothetical protein